MDQQHGGEGEQSEQGLSGQPPESPTNPAIGWPTLHRLPEVNIPPNSPAYESFRYLETLGVTTDNKEE